jgi:uncharacterized membrane protein
MRDEAHTIRRLLQPDLIFAAAGLLLSLYLTVEHFTTPRILACPATSGIDCTKVTTSPWSEFLGVPVAVLGLGYFVVMTALVLPASWRVRRLRLVRVVAAGGGVLMVLYLIWAELFRVNAICLWCTGVHLCTLALFAAVLWRWTNGTDEDTASD